MITVGDIFLLFLKNPALLKPSRFPLYNNVVCWNLIFCDNNLHKYNFCTAFNIFESVKTNNP